LRRPEKILFSGQKPLSGSATGPSNTLHPAASTLRADADVNLPYRFYKFSYGQVGISCPETLMPLKGKYQLQVFAFPPVIQKPIVSDLLETGGEHMHQITADEFCIFQRDSPGWLTRLLPPGGK
jgi:hypothetical protein